MNTNIFCWEMFVKAKDIRAKEVEAKEVSSKQPMRSLKAKPKKDTAKEMGEQQCSAEQYSSPTGLPGRESGSYQAI